MSRPVEIAKGFVARLRPLFESEIFAIAVIVVVAAVTRFYQLGTESLWLDEATTFQRSSLPLPELVADAKKAYHNPSYFILMHYWLMLGDSEAMLRLPSALSGFLQVPVIYVLGRIAGGRFTAFAGALVLSLNLRSVAYSQEARMYALYCLAASVAMAGLAWLVKHPAEAAQRPWRPRGTSEAPRATAPPAAKRAWIAFIIGAVVSLYCHATAVLFVVSCSVVAVLFLIVRREERWGFFVNWVIANVVVLIAFGPWIPSLFGQTDAMVEKGFWLADPTSDSVLTQLRSTFGFGKWLVPFVLSALLGSFALRRSPLLLASLWLLALLGPGLLLLASLRQPVFMPRLFLWSVAPFSVLVGAGLVAIRYVAVKLAFLTAFAIFAAYWLNRAYYENDTKPNWHGAIKLISGRLKEGERVIAIARRERRLLFYYFERQSNPVPAFDYVEVVGSGDEKVEKLIGDARAVWTIQGRRWETADKVRAKIAARGRRGVHRQFGGDVVVERYTLRSDKKRDK
jgi:uncharacterized membrane protein